MQARSRSITRMRRISKRRLEIVLGKNRDQRRSLSNTVVEEPQEIAIGNIHRGYRIRLGILRD